MPTKKEIAAFEAGIKLGALYHQFVGAPVNMNTADSLERAMQESISLQPNVSSVKISINREMLEGNIFGYSELQGKMINARVEIDYEGETVSALLNYDSKKSYPFMRLI